MTTDRRRQVEDLFHNALERDVQERTLFLDDACAHDLSLRLEVEALLAAHESAGSLGESPDSQQRQKVHALSAGQRLGPYEIEALIATGGMGQVYRARDTRLDRTVAVKVLSPQLVWSAAGRDRFNREARAVSRLSHSHICPLYDVGESEGIPFLVMEYLEGESLATRLRRGKLPVEVAVEYAVAIAEALDAAHSAGVIHRDLKPSNIMLTKAGPKVLDFGLAQMETREATGDKTEGIITETGIVLGTLSYMAPEQLEGKKVDGRSDIFAFGAVLHEMVTGDRAFEGATSAAVIASILGHHPPGICELDEQVPPSLDRTVRTCLAKSPADRWQSAGDLLQRLKNIKEHELKAAITQPVTAAHKRRTRLLSLLAASAGVLVAFLTVPAVWRGVSNSERVVGQQISRPSTINQFALSVSHDGRYVAFLGGENGTSRLFVKSRESEKARPIPGTEGATLSHFWSPTRNSIAFRSGGVLRTIDVEVAGARPIALTDFRGSGSSMGGSWNATDDIIFSTLEGIYKISAVNSGKPTQVTKAQRGFELHIWPSFLPDGRHFLFFVQTKEPGKGGIYVGSLDSDMKTQILNVHSMAMYAPPGFLLFYNHGVLMAQPFDADSRTLSGKEQRVGEGIPVGFNTEFGRAGFSTSADGGTLVYFIGDASLNTARMAWINRRSGKLEPAGYPLPAIALRLSRLEDKVALTLRSDVDVENPSTPQRSSVWIYNLKNNHLSPLMNNPAGEHWPEFSPDGAHIAFDIHNGQQEGRIFVKAIDSARPESLLFSPEPGMGYGVLNWSRDGKYIMFMKRRPNDYHEFRVLRMSDKAELPYPIIPSSRQTNAAISPNGRWLAYTSDEGGVNEVFVQAFPVPTTIKKSISLKGGAFPRWKGDGKELYYLNAMREIVAVPVNETNDSIEFGQEVVLFPTQQPINFPKDAGNADVGPAYTYDVTRDGERFLVLVRSTLGAAPEPLTVFFNWQKTMLKPSKD